MFYQGTQEVVLHCYNSSPKVYVEFEYYFEPGVMTLNNGDPGYPDEEELIILGILDDKDNCLDDKFNRMELIFKNFKDFNSPFEYISKSINTKKLQS
jgi:hypothetical protein